MRLIFGRKDRKDARRRGTKKKSEVAVGGEKTERLYEINKITEKMPLSFMNEERRLLLNHRGGRPTFIKRGKGINGNWPSLVEGQSPSHTRWRGETENFVGFGL